MEKLEEITKQLFETATPAELKSSLNHVFYQYLMAKEVEPKRELIENFYFLFDFLDKAERLSPGNG